ncbi:MAG: hypothetical protein ACJ8FB_09215 [Sphingomicrobium sp.]
MSKDFGQWGKTCFTDLRNLYVRVGDDLATAWCLLSFQIGDQPSIPIRPADHRTNALASGYLTQNANSVMTSQ